MLRTESTDEVSRPQQFEEFGIEADRPLPFYGRSAMHTKKPRTTVKTSRGISIDESWPSLSLL